MTYETKIVAMQALSSLKEQSKMNLENATKEFYRMAGVNDTFEKSWSGAIDFWSKELKKAEKAYNEILNHDFYFTK